MMQSVQLGNVQCAFTLPLPPCPPGSIQSFEGSQIPFSSDEDVSHTENQRDEVSPVIILSSYICSQISRVNTI